MEPIPEGKVRCEVCGQIVRPDRVNDRGVCEHCIVLGPPPKPPQEEVAA